MTKNIEPDPFAGLEDARRPNPDEPHVVVVVGHTGKKPYANVVGPFPTKTKATTFAVRSRKRARRDGDTQRWGLTFHVRPLMDPKEVER